MTAPTPRGSLRMGRNGCSTRSTGSSGASFRRGPPRGVSAGTASTPPCAERTTWMATDLRLPFDDPPSPVEVMITRDQAARACAMDPARNVVLEASAGTGKTHVLVTRYINLLCAGVDPVSYTHLRAHETRHDIVCRLLLE